MKSCAKCMAENADDAKFCKLCSSPLQQGAGRACPSGKHIMDPMWAECAYCKADAAAGTPRPVGPPSLPPRPAPVMPPPLARAAATPPGGRKETVVENSFSAGPPPPPSVRPPTQREDSPVPPRPAPRPFPMGAGGPASPVTPNAAAPAAPAPNRGRTVFASTLSPVQPPSAAKGRKIVGVLVTYSWHPEGKVYEVREGRNLIGRDATCEVSVPEDATLSGVNSHITYRSSFVIGDMVSMMGTDLNGVSIEEQFCKLPNHAAIRCGSTHFTFISVSGDGEPRSAAE